MEKMILLGLSGALGTLARYTLSGLVQRLNGLDFPLGTFSVNILGCFLFGLVWALAENRLLISGETRTIVLSGFMGAFTTFSTFIFESGGMLQTAQWMLAALNIGGQVVTGVAALWLGLALGR